MSRGTEAEQTLSVRVRWPDGLDATTHAARLLSVAMHAVMAADREFRARGDMPRIQGRHYVEAVLDGAAMAIQGRATPTDSHPSGGAG